MDIKPRKFKLLSDRTLRGEVFGLKDDTVYELMGHDYGLASEDSRNTGYEHISVTKDPEGRAPSFTIPTSSLREIE